jgi:hypothetical protein
MASNFEKLARRVATLSKGQLALLDSIIDTFKQPMEASHNQTSDVVSPEFQEAFGDVLKLHHAMSEAYLDKYRFESAMVRVMNAIGRKAERAVRCNPGHDVTVDGIAWSLKTQGDQNIKIDTLHISKFMELGKGEWIDVKSLGGLRKQFLRHLDHYERIFQLRYFKCESGEGMPMSHYYELVEIPKALLQRAAGGKLRMMVNSTQTPKPGYCDVFEKPRRALQFRLYFDGGTERKLQIKDLAKQLCVVHATWKF